MSRPARRTGSNIALLTMACSSRTVTQCCNLAIRGLRMAYSGTELGFDSKGCGVRVLLRRLSQCACWRKLRRDSPMYSASGLSSDDDASDSKATGLKENATSYSSPTLKLTVSPRV